jgi:hypothetical protein
MRWVALMWVALILTFTACAFADERTVTMVNGSTPRGQQEMATIIRTVVDIPKVSTGTDGRSFHLDAPSAPLDAAEWIIHQLDRPAGWEPSPQERTNPSTRQFRLPPGTLGGDVIRVYYMPDSITSQSMQETLTVLRTVMDMQKIFSYSSCHALVYRGTEDWLDALEWLLPALQLRTVSALYKLPPEGSMQPGLELVRVFPLSAGSTGEQTNQLLRELRMKPVSIQKVFTRTIPPAIVVRGTAAELDQAARKILPAPPAAH